jgi:hypothetical protein
MIDKDAATSLVRSRLSTMKIWGGKNALWADDELLLLENETIERDSGWVFSYNSKKYLKTGDRRWALRGNAPIIVDRLDGSMHVTGTARPVEYYIAEYEKKRAAGSASKPDQRR